MGVMLSQNMNGRKAIVAYLNPNIGRLTYSKHIYQLLISFILALDQGPKSPVFGVIHYCTLTIVTAATVIKLR